MKTVTTNDLKNINSWKEQGVSFQELSFDRLNMKDLNFDGLDMTGCVFNRCNLNNCTFVGTNLTKSEIAYCNCIECSLNNANLSSVHISHTNFDKTWAMNVTTDENFSDEFSSYDSTFKSQEDKDAYDQMMKDMEVPVEEESTEPTVD